MKIIQYPVTYLDTINHLRLESSDDNNAVQRLIRSATRLAENYTDMNIALREHTLIDNTDNGDIVFTANNFRKIESVKIDGSEYSEFDILDITTFNDNYNTYLLDLKGAAGEVELKYTTGFAQNECDESIQTAILLKVGELYDVDRSGYVFNNYRSTNSFERILDYHKRIYFR